MIVALFLLSAVLTTRPESMADISLSPGEPAFISRSLPASEFARWDDDPFSSARPYHFPEIAPCEELTIVRLTRNGRPLVLAKPGTPGLRIVLSWNWSTQVHHSLAECRAVLSALSALSTAASPAVMRDYKRTFVSLVNGTAAGTLAMAAPGEDLALWPHVGAGVYVARSLAQTERLRDRLKINRTYGWPPREPRPPLAPDSWPSRDTGHHSQRCGLLRVADVSPVSLLVTETEPRGDNVMTYQYSLGADWKDVTFRTEEDCVRHVKEQQAARHKETRD